MRLVPGDEMVYPSPSIMAQAVQRPIVPPDLNGLQKIIQTIFQSARITILRVEVYKNRTHPIRILQLSDGSSLVLRMNTSPTVPLLRSELQVIETEAHVLMLLAESRLPIPTVLGYDPSIETCGSSFLLTSQLPGTPLSTILPCLSRSQRTEIDYQISHLEAIMAQYMSPAFGPVALVASGRGFKRWRDAFKSMLGTILTDGEDMFVNLPYMQIREQVTRAEKSLDEVQEARLIVLDLGDADNVLVDEQTKKVTGLIGFQRALWGDPAMVTGETVTSLKGLL